LISGAVNAPSASFAANLPKIGRSRHRSIQPGLQYNRWVSQIPPSFIKAYIF